MNGIQLTFFFVLVRFVSRLDSSVSLFRIGIRSGVGHVVVNIRKNLNG